MLHGSSEELEERLSQLRSQIDQLTAAIPSPRPATDSSSAVAPTLAPNDSQRVDGKLEKFEARLDQQLTDLSDQVQAIVAEIRARAARRPSAVTIDTASRAPKPRDWAPQTPRGALDRGQALESVPLLERDDESFERDEEVFEGEVIMVQPVPRRRFARGAPSAQLLGGVLVLGVIGAGAVAGAVLLFPTRFESARPLTQGTQTETAASAAVEAARQQAAAASQESAKRLAEARAALQRAVDRIESGEPIARGGQAADPIARTAIVAAPAAASAAASAAANALPTTPGVAPAIAVTSTPVAPAVGITSPPPSVPSSSPSPSSPTPSIGQEGLAKNGDAVVPPPQSAAQNPPAGSASPAQPIAASAAAPTNAGSNLEPGSGVPAPAPSRLLVSSVAVPAGPVIGGIVPISPFASTGSQTILVSGQGFQSGLRVTAFLPGNTGPTTISSIQVQRVTATSLEIVTSLASRGAWGLRVDNPDGKQSTVYSFTVR